MFGYATNETDSYMPAPIIYSHRLVEKQAQVRKNGKLPWLRPDAKSQCTFRYEDDKPVGIDAVVLSTQHSPDIKLKALQEAIMEEVIKPVLPKKWLDQEDASSTSTRPAGSSSAARWATAASRAVRSSSTATAVSHATAAARSRARTPRRSTARPRMPLATSRRTSSRRASRSRCEVQVSYAIGVAKPTSVTVETFGTNTVPEEKIIAAVSEELRSAPVRHRQDARPPEADLQEDGVLRPLRPRRLQLGEDRQAPPR